MTKTGIHTICPAVQGGKKPVIPVAAYPVKYRTLPRWHTRAPHVEDHQHYHGVGAGRRRGYAIDAITDRFISGSVLY